MSADGQSFFIYGPPGTGLRKTTYLARQAQRAAETHGADSVAIASLTRAAATEIGNRDTTIPGHLVGTMHRHCLHHLDRPDLAETPEGIRAWNDAHPHQAISRGNQLEDVIDGSGGDGAGDTIHQQVMIQRARMTPRTEWTLEQRSHDADWTDFKRQTKRLDFTDLIEEVIADGGPHHLHPKVLLLDEAQDFTALELTLAKQWAAHTETTVLAGDPDQAIFSWRGASPRGAERLADQSRRLEQSHRVPVAVHAMARTWIRRIEDRADIPYHPTAVTGSVGRGGPLRDPGPLLDVINTETGEGRSVMVLASCGYMLTPIIGALRDAGTPFHNPYRTNDGRWNPLRGAGRLKAYLRASDRIWGSEARCWTWDDMRLWTDPLHAKTSLARGAKTFIEAKCQRDRFGETRADDEVPADQVYELLDVAPGSTRHPALRMDAEWWYQHLRAKERKTAEYPMQVLRAGGHEALAADPQVCVGTIHSVKGGEASTVVVAPDLSVQGYWGGWRPGGPGRDAITRMFYVAITRARERVILLDPSGTEHCHRELGEAIEGEESREP